MVLSYLAATAVLALSLALASYITQSRRSSSPSTVMKDDAAALRKNNDHLLGLSIEKKRLLLTPPTNASSQDFNSSNSTVSLIQSHSENLTLLEGVEDVIYEVFKTPQTFSTLRVGRAHGNPEEVQSEDFRLTIQGVGAKIPTKKGNLFPFEVFACMWNSLGCGVQADEGEVTELKAHFGEWEGIPMRSRCILKAPIEIDRNGGFPMFGIRIGIPKEQLPELEPLKPDPRMAQNGLYVKGFVNTLGTMSKSNFLSTSQPEEMVFLQNEATQAKYVLKPSMERDGTRNHLSASVFAY